jgi:hypothetical protein
MKSLSAPKNRTLEQHIASAKMEAQKASASATAIRAFHKKGRPNHSSAATAAGAISAWNLCLKHAPK